MLLFSFSPAAVRAIMPESFKDILAAIYTENSWTLEPRGLGTTFELHNLPIQQMEIDQGIHLADRLDQQQGRRWDIGHWSKTLRYLNEGDFVSPHSSIAIWLLFLINLQERPNALPNVDWWNWMELAFRAVGFYWRRVQLVMERSSWWWRLPSRPLFLEPPLKTCNGNWSRYPCHPVFCMRYDDISCQDCHIKES